MTSLSKDEIDRIAASLAPLIIKQIQANHHEFWVDPETHYRDHLDWGQWRKSLNTAQKIFWTAFIGLIVIGSFVLASVGIMPKLFGKGP